MVYQQGLNYRIYEGKTESKVIYRYWPDNDAIVEGEFWVKNKVQSQDQVCVCVCVCVRLGMLISQSDDVSISKLGLKVQEIRLGEMAF